LTASFELKFQSEKAKKFMDDIVKGVSGVEAKSKPFMDTLSAIVFSDIIDHFENEKGPNGKWKMWSRFYAERMARTGKGGNKILQDSGRLKGAFKPSNMRRQRDGILWFNNAKTSKGFPYASAHDEGGPKLPQRQFMWLSDKAISNIESATLKFVEG